MESKKFRLFCQKHGLLPFVIVFFPPFNFGMYITVVIDTFCCSAIILRCRHFFPYHYTHHLILIIISCFFLIDSQSSSYHLLQHDSTWPYMLLFASFLQRILAPQKVSLLLLVKLTFFGGGPLLQQGFLFESGPHNNCRFLKSC